MCEDDYEEGEMVEALIDAVADRIDLEYEKWKQGLLDICCALCNRTLQDLDAVHTKLGLAHERCAQERWPENNGDGGSIWPY